ncbi:hypothetical protein FP828_02500 [bacterium]|nr:hypothetical protein [bacterium]
MKKNVLIKFYVNKRLSMVETAVCLNTTPSKIYYWLKKYDIPRRSRSQSAYIKHNPGWNPFKIKQKLSSEEKQMSIAALMLYWAEGNKSKKSVVQIGNLDYKILKIFLIFLRRICRVKEDKIILYVRLHHKFDASKAQKYWSDKLSLSLDQIRMYKHRDERSKFNKQWSQNGIAMLQFSNTELKKLFDKKIDSVYKGILKNERK